MQHAILTLIRHAETTGNVNRLLQGVTDSPVTVFGQAQIEALARTWATTRPARTQLPDSIGKASKEEIPKLDLPPPTLVVCSPIGRARKTAEAIHSACTSTPSENAGVHEYDPNDTWSTRLNVATHRLSQRGLVLLVDPGLAEKDFGWKESTRGGVHIAGYPQGHGSGESRIDFAQRVHRVGAEWLQAAALLAASCSEQTIPHIVLVSHGMWITTFLSTHPPTTITQVSGQAGFLPFAANTGMFSLKVVLKESKGAEAEAKAKATPTTELFRVNDIRHLAHVKRQKGGIGRGAFDSKQTKLSSFLAPLPTKTSVPHGESTAPSPAKKRKV